MMSQQYSPAGFNLLPPVVKNLLIINGLFFLATSSLGKTFGIDLSRILGLYYFQSELFSPYQFVSYLFLHADFPHLLFNMFALWMFGYMIENIWGSKRFLTYYMITGIGAAFVQTFVNFLDISSVQAAANTYAQSPTLDGFVGFVRHHFPQYYENPGPVKAFIDQWSLARYSPGFVEQSFDFTNQLIRLKMDVPTIGASGAVFGILLAFGMLFPNMFVYILGLFPIKAKWVVIFYGVSELFLGIKSTVSDNIAHFAHLGGMLFGFILIVYWKNKTGNNQS